MNGRRQRLRAGAGVFFRGCQVFEKLTDEFCAHASIENRAHSYCATKPSVEQGDLLAGTDVARRVNVVAADLHVTGVAGLRGQRSAFVKPRRPKALINADTRRRLDGRRVRGAVYL